jgi:NitT/TauT family transport system substrate-binding protein
MRLDPAGVPLLNPGRRAIRARCALAAVSGLALLLAAGCGNSGSPGGAVSSTVVIAAVPGVSDAAIYLAQKDGFFASEGLDHVVIKTYQNQAAVLGALKNGNADIAASDYGNIFYQQAQSGDLRILADGYDAATGSLEMLTYPGSGIQNPSDLTSPQDNPSQVVGVPDDDLLPSHAALYLPTAPTSLDVAAAADVLKSFVGNAADSLRWKPMSQQQEVSELQSHQLKAILVSEPYIYQAESQLSAVEVLDACSGETAGMPLLGYVALSAWVGQNPGAVADFQAALAKAQTDASLAGQVQRVLHSATGMSVQDADLITVGSYPTSTSIPNLQSVATLMADAGVFNTGDMTVANRLNINTMLVKPQS